MAFVTSIVCGTVGVALFGASPTSDRVRGIAAVIGAIGTLFVAAQVILPIAVVAGGTAAWVYSAYSPVVAGSLIGITAPVVGVIFVLMSIYGDENQA